MRGPTPEQLERGTGLGLELDWTVRPPTARHATGRQALEAVVEQALRRPPCVVSFSGGRDSSAILAVATHVARREGLPLPIPVSLRFPGCERAEESSWQEIVVSHLGLDDWQRLTFDDEMDLIGPIAQPVLREHGRLRPYNAHFHVPVFDLARGGSALSGIYGDQVLASDWVWHAENVALQHQRSLTWRDPVRIAVSLLGTRRPRAAFLRRRDARRGAPLERPRWMKPYAFEALIDRIVYLDSTETLSFRRSLTRTLWRMRARRAGLESLRLLGAPRDVEHVAPFAHPDFVGAISHERSWRMFASRTEATDHLVGDLLPQALLSRPTKAAFNTAFFNRHTRSFAATWDGAGVDPRFVDADELRRGWLEDESPDGRTSGLVQDAWLASQP